MKPEKQINCNFCKGRRNVYHGLCDGCGHPEANVTAGSKQRQPAAARVPACPACHSSNRQELEPGRWLCRGCAGIFETEDVGYLDDRPDVNAQKREAATNGRKRRNR